MILRPDIVSTDFLLIGIPCAPALTSVFSHLNNGGFNYMKVRISICLLLFAFALAAAPSSLFSQAAEINPYAGFYWPGNNDSVGDFKNNQLLGVRGGGYLTTNFELGANWAWTNHFQPKSTNPASAFAGSLGFPQNPSRAHIAELEFTYNFGKTALFGTSFRPYIVGGAGTVWTRTEDAGTFVMNVRPVDTPVGPGFVPNDVLSNNDVFFTFSYGGGMKFNRVVGPMGFFGDFRGRTMPNFFGSSTTWPELSAGLTFSWGER
jgi:hypothetical protein